MSSTAIQIAFGAALLTAAVLPCPASAATPLPQFTGTTTRNVGTIGGRERIFWLYVPKDLKPGAALVFVLHGGGGNGPTILEGTGHEFDLLADKFGFVVVYPDGIGKSWNHCRKLPPNDSKKQNVDDVGFFEAIIAHEAAMHRIDRKRVFATGHSNGGQMSYRLALEHPDEFAAVAAISANLPADDNNDCKPVGKPVQVMIMNGTADPVSPYNGGSGGFPLNELSGNPLGDLFNAPAGGRNSQRRGAALSTDATAAYFARLNGITAAPEKTRLPHVNTTDRTAVDRTLWSEPGKPPVVLYSIVGGGHVVPQPYWHFPRQVGAQTEDVDAPAVIWEFFSKISPAS